MNDKKLSELTVLCKDSGGLGIEHAVALGKVCKEVIYFNTWQDGFCQSKKYFLGRGFENIRKTLYFDDEIDRADLIVFTDIGYGDNANRLRKQGKVVFGAGSAEKFENHRFAFRAMQKRIGLYPAPYKTCQATGVDELIKYLQANKNQYVKVDNAFRGDCESFPAKNYDEVKSRIDYLRVKFGPYADTVNFTIEDMVNADVEIGIDGFFSGDLVRPSLWGFETARCYIGRFSENLPPVLEDCIARLGPEMKKKDYRGAFSTESRVLNKNSGVMIDPCMRFPYNLSLGYGEWIENYAELIWSVAKGETVKIKPRAKYVGGAPLYVNNEEEWVEWIFPKELRDQGKIKFRECAKHSGKYYAIRGCNSAVWVISWGNTIESVIKDIEATAEKIDAMDINKSRVRDLRGEVLPHIQAARSMGIEF